MASGSITERAVDVAVAGSFLWDTEVRGIGLKVTAAGAKSYVYQYRLDGRGTKVRRYAIGPHGPRTPDAARREARRLAQMVDTGVDPAAAKQARQRQLVDLAFPVDVTPVSSSTWT